LAEFQFSKYRNFSLIERDLTFDVAMKVLSLYTFHVEFRFCLDPGQRASARPQSGDAAVER